MYKNLKPLKHEAVKLLIVHCSGSRCNQPFTVEGLIATGKARFGQPSYHYYVQRNGDIIPILPETVQGVHAKHYNHCSIGICYEGAWKVYFKSRQSSLLISISLMLSSLPSTISNRLNREKVSS